MSEESSDAPVRAEEGSSAEVRAALQAIREDVARLSDDIAQLARDRADSAGATITGAVASAKSQVAQAKSDIGDCLRGAEARLRSQIQESPLTLAVVLIAVGYALGRQRNARRR